MRFLLISVIHGYQKFISPLTPHSCRFLPTCSDYMIQAIEKYGAVQGLYRGIRRILRCHPFNAGGFDPA